MAQKNKMNLVEWAMHYRQIVIMITCVLIAFGFYGLYGIRKNEFPDITIRQGVVVAVYPSASALEVEQQVTKPLEEYIFTYKDVNKVKTKSYSRNSVAIIQIELNDDIKDKDEFWSKFKHGMESFKGQLPDGVGGQDLPRTPRLHGPVEEPSALGGKCGTYHCGRTAARAD